MNKTYRIGKEILAVMLLLIVLLSGCQSGGGKGKKSEPAVEPAKDNTQVIQDIKQAE